MELLFGMACYIAISVIGYYCLPLIDHIIERLDAQS